MEHKTCLITGATSGIGKAVALEMARRGFRVLVLGRSEAKLARTCKAIARRGENAEVGAFLADLSILADVRSVVGIIRSECDRLDVLVNNAGARYMRHELTTEGIEKTLATNHLGHFVLTLGLLDLMKGPNGARIINVSSGTHTAARDLIGNVTSPSFYDGRLQYANSKLANILFTYKLAERLKGSKVTVNVVDPGGVASHFARNNGLVYWLKHVGYYAGRGQLVSSRKGAETIIYLATSPLVEGITGGYFAKKAQGRSSLQSYDRSLQERLWALSLKWSRMEPDKS
ncbi:MAG TPA: SDR family oxidoreductase [Candidatus Aminicenantes bacterium]|nr:SDR family oxidoreductase [Candidatus Aminicenantes bacterium]